MGRTRMTVFTVLKYGNINLGKEEELKTLPEGLLRLYWKKANELGPDKFEAHINLDRIIRSLRLWYGDDTYEYEKQVARRIFISALEEYDDLQHN